MSFWKKLFGRAEAKPEVKFPPVVAKNPQTENDGESLILAVGELLRADTAWEIEGCLYRHPELLEQKTDSVIQALELSNSNNQQYRLKLQIYRAMLARYRQLGTEDAVFKDSIRTLNDLFNLPSSQWPAFIKQHLELLSPLVEATLGLFIEKEKNIEKKKKITESQRLFAICRQVGIDQAFAEGKKQTTSSVKKSQNQILQELFEMGLIESTEPVSGVIDEFGCKPLDYHKQFEEDLIQANLLEAVWKQDPPSMLPLIKIYESILERETLDKYPEFFAGIHFNLGNLYGQLPFGNLGGNRNLAIQHYEQALSFFTEENFPDDYAGIMSSLGIIHAELSRGRDPNLG